MYRIENCNVAVVGGCGFLGSHLVGHLIEERNCKVLAIDNLVVGKIEFLHPKAEFTWHDITGSEERLKQIFQKFEVDYVFNYAAYPYIPVSFERPLHVFNVNANGAIKVINAAQEAGVKRILQVSSAEIYGEGCQVSPKHIGDPLEGVHSKDVNVVKLTEESLVRPHSSYGAAKAAVDYYCQCAWRERKTPVIALRQFNCVGERETHPYVIPEIINQLYGLTDRTTNAKQKHKVFLGNNSFRDFLYAGDAVAMAVELLDKGNLGEVYNLGSESGIKIYDLAKLIGILIGSGEPEVIQDPKRIRPWEIWHLQSNNSKIYSVIERRPKVCLEKALKLTINDFYKNKQKWVWEK